MKSKYWCVLVDASVKPLVERIAIEEDRVPSQVVRRLINNALKQYTAEKAGTAA